MMRTDWHADDLRADTSWIFSLDDRAQRDLLAAVRKARDPDKSMFDYSRGDFNLASAQPTIEAAFTEARHGRGIALLRGLPRAALDEPEFELLTWAIGLHVGVARPQGKASQYISAVRDAGTVYRSAGGRGYSSNADLDFHTDSADLVALACYNQAQSGGLSMVTSSVAAYQRMAAEHPDLADALRAPFWFSRQMEQAPDETAAYPNPVYDEADGMLCSKWNRNRIQIAQRIDGVPPLTARRRLAMDALDDTLRRPDLMHEMYLQPGDVQILNNHVTLHSRTEFVDYEEPSRKRLLFRLWLAPPDSPRLPDSWLPAYRSVAPRTVRGGIMGQAYDERRRAYEQRQAAELGFAG
ncbi:MAG TPA: TauD/TfdA family dioxygenase [Acetobacteraceae bacterium]|jgi:alpha-ketoglutarate-dependent taurine dioxygenase